MALARPDEQETCPYHGSFVSLYDGQGVFVWSDCLLDLVMDFLSCNAVFVRDAYYFVEAPHFLGLFLSLQLCGEGP